MDWSEEDGETNDSDWGGWGEPDEDDLNYIDPESFEYYFDLF